MIVGLCGIGDFLFFLPALKALRTYFDKAEIDLLSFPNGLDDLLKYTGLISRVIIFPFTKYFDNADKGLLSADFKGLCKTVWAIRQNEYDISIWPFAFSSAKKKILNCFFSADFNAMHRNSPSLLVDRLLCSNTHWVEFRKNVHSVDLNNSLLDCLDVKTMDKKINISLSGEDKAFGRRYLESVLKGRKKRFIGIHPGGKISWSPDRQWDASKFALVADRMSQKYNAVSLLFGSKSEEAVLAGIADLMLSETVIVSTFTIRQVASIISLLDVFVGNDSALVHVAASFGVKAVSVNGPTNFERTGPWGENSHVVRLDLPCSPCFDVGFSSRCKHKFCLKKLEAVDVYNVIDDITDDKNIELQPVVHNISQGLDLTSEFPEFIRERRSWEVRYGLK